MTRPFESLDSADTRDCQLYRIKTWAHPGPRYTRQVERGYVGETAREPLERALEHFKAQPFGDLFAGFEVDPVIYPGKAAVVAAEKAAIETEQPRYNVEFNRGNPDRISRQDAIRQRWARDDDAGRPRWTEPRTVPRQRGRATRTVSRPGRRRWEPWQVKTAVWGSAFFMLWVGFWPALDDLGAPTRQGAIGAAIAAGALLTWGIRRRPRRRRR